MVEYHLAKVAVAGSSPVARSTLTHRTVGFLLDLRQSDRNP